MTNGDVMAEERATKLVDGMHIKRKRDDDEGDNWREEERLMAATAIATEIFMERRAGYEPIEVSDVFQAETTMLQAIDFNVDFRDVETWTDFGYVAPHYLGTGCHENKGLLEHEKEDEVGSHGRCHERPPWGEMEQECGLGGTAVLGSGRV